MSISFKNISFSYNPQKGIQSKIFDDLSLSFEAGKIVAIVGPSGSGKSTLLKLICGLLTPLSGSIEIESLTVEKAQRNRLFGLVFQSPDLLPWRTLIRNVSLPFELQNRKVDKKRASELIKDIGLAGWEDKYPYQLSGGMQQRTAIARALVTKPPILLLDEPFSQLDELLRFELFLYIQNYALKNNATVVFVTHNINEAVLISDKVYILSSPPIFKLDEIVINLERPRSFETSNQDTFHDLVAEIRDHLLKSKQLHKIA